MAAPRSILVLRHEPFEHLGHIADIFTGHKIPFRYRDLQEPVDPQAGSQLQGHDGLVIMGGPQSANDPLPGLAAEIEIIASAVEQQIPVLGICLGAQLIAKTLGARVYRNAEKEIGWAPVFFTEAAQSDPLFSGLPSPTTFFHWHGETFDLPADTDWLAYSDLCRHQAFRYGKNVYGVQFHPEITPGMIVDWSDQPANCGDVDGLAAPIEAHSFDSAPLARRMVDGWLSTF
jgi:GMP synthase-like glutamine amidotransferase